MREASAMSRREGTRSCSQSGVSAATHSWRLSRPTSLQFVPCLSVPNPCLVPHPSGGVDAPPSHQLRTRSGVTVPQANVPVPGSRSARGTLLLVLFEEGEQLFAVFVVARVVEQHL